MKTEVPDSNIPECGPRCHRSESTRRADATKLDDLHAPTLASQFAVLRIAWPQSTFEERVTFKQQRQHQSFRCHHLDRQHFVGLDCGRNENIKFAPRGTADARLCSHARSHAAFIFHVDEAILAAPSSTDCKRVESMRRTRNVDKPFCLPPKTTPQHLSAYKKPDVSRAR